MIEDKYIEFGLLTLLREIWLQKWFVGAVAAIFAAVSIVYALLATEWYRADVLLAPASDRSDQNLGAQFGGLASLAGINLASEGSAEPIAILRSREFARNFIEDMQILPMLFADDWDENAGKWRVADPDKQPDIRDAVKIFREELLRVTEDSQSGLVTVSLEWIDPDTAAEWAGLLVSKLNSRMRMRALAESEKNVAYLQSELKGESVVAIQQSLGRVLESELQNLMLAKGNEEFSFRVIDPPAVPKYRSRPKRTLLVVASTFFGGMVGVFLALLRRARRTGIL